MREVRTFVKQGHASYELTPGGRLLIGRSDECDIVIDDGLTSREHAVVEQIGDDLQVRDLDSRNGTIINGLKIDSKETVHHGDLVTIGRSQLTIVRQAHEPRPSRPSRMGRLRKTSAADSTGVGSVFEILGGGTRTSIQDGDLPGAERTAMNLFVAIRRFVARGRTVDAHVFSDAVDIGLMLARGLGEASWIERVLELHVLTHRPIDARVLERTVEIASEVGHPERGLEEFVSFARQVGGVDDAALAALSPSE